MGKIIYLDMDGVICDFLGKYVEPDKEDSREKFRKSVMCGKIFENLNMTPRADTLLLELNYLCQRKDVKLEFLTSVASFGDDELAAAAASQKTKWLLNLNLTFPVNFTTSGLLKAKYANAESILIDDLVENCEAFSNAGGYGIHYEPSNLNNIIYKLYQIC